MTLPTPIATLVATDNSVAVGRVVGELLVLVGIPYLLWRLGRRFGVQRGLMIMLVFAVVVFMVIATAVGHNSSSSLAAGPIPMSPTSAVSASASTRNPFSGLPPAEIYFVPLDAHARTLIMALAPLIQKWLPHAVQLRAIPAAPGWINQQRSGEWNGGNIAQDLLADYKSARGSGQVFIMAVTSQAIYDPSAPYYSFVFGVLQWHSPQFAAVFGTRPMRVVQPQREQARLTKMMLRYIGQIVCNQPRNNDPRSVLNKTILGTPDLDRMAAVLPAACYR